MNLIVEENIVYQVETTPGGSVIKTAKDAVLHTRLEYDPASGKVRASVYNYLGEPVPDFADPIVFELDGQQVMVTPVNGVAEIDFVAEVPGDYVVRTANSGIRNGEVTIVVA